MLIEVHITQPDMVVMRMARPTATAISPSVVRFCAHSQIDSAPVATTSAPLLVETQRFIRVMSRVWR